MTNPTLRFGDTLTYYTSGVAWRCDECGRRVEIEDDLHVDCDRCPECCTYCEPCDTCTDRCEHAGVSA